MGAFNWIEFQGRCPSCATNTTIRAQTHVASDYGGDATGRFHDRTYRLGETMAWWPREDQRFDRWREVYEDAIEACYSNCSACNAELCAVIRFQDRSPIEVRALTTEENWPPSFPR